MKKFLFLVAAAVSLLSLMTPVGVRAQSEPKIELDSVFVSETDGPVALPGAHASLRIPSGLAFLSKARANYLYTRIYDEMPAPYIVGALVPRTLNEFVACSTVAFIYYNPVGYVKMDDLANVDTARLLNTAYADRGAEWIITPAVDRASSTVRLAIHCANEGAYWSDYQMFHFGRKGFVAAHLMSFDKSTEKVFQFDAIAGSLFTFDSYFDYGSFIESAETPSNLSLAEVVFPEGHELTSDDINDYFDSDDSPNGFWETVGMVIAGLVLFGICALSYWFVSKGAVWSVNLVFNFLGRLFHF